jgi:integrase
MLNDLKAADGKKGLSAKSIRNIHGVLHRALQQAVTLGYIRVNPTNACILPRLIKKDIKPLDEEQIADFLTALDGHEFERIYIVSLFTGIRQGEALGLMWDCVDYERGQILIKRQLLRDYEKGGYYVDTVKNDKARTITPAPFVMNTLRLQQEEQTKMRTHAGEAWEVNNFVFTNALGQHLKHVTVFKNYKRVVSSIGIPTARYHDLRHTYAVTSLLSGDDLKTIQENLGHHTAAFTLDKYGHVTERMKQESAQRMEAFIKGVKRV